MRIGFTQRVEVVGAAGERRDCLDQAWARLASSLGWVPVSLSNAVPDAAGYATSVGIEGLILTGGNDPCGLPGAANTAPERDRFEQALLEFSVPRRLPVLGVCRGAQVLARFHGAPLVRVEGHVRVRHPLGVKEDAFVLRPRGSVVNSYHGYGIRRGSLVAPLREVAWTEDDVVEAMRHESLPHFAVFWHPERETPFVAADLEMIRRIFGSGAGHGC